MDIGTEVSVLTKNSLNPFSHIDSQSVIGNGYIEVSKWRFLFKGKKDKRNCEIFHMGDNEKRPEVTSDGLNVRVLLGVER